jgi:hypothetical protein
MYSRIWIPIQRRIRILDAQKHLDPVDPDPDCDPEHRYKKYMNKGL